MKKHRHSNLLSSLCKYMMELELNPGRLASEFVPFNTLQKEQILGYT